MNVYIKNQFDTSKKSAVFKLEGKKRETPKCFKQKISIKEFEQNKVESTV